MSDELKRCPFCGRIGEHYTYRDCAYALRAGVEKLEHSLHDQIVEDNERIVSRNERILALEAENAALKSENVKLSKKVTDYEKELRQLHKYDNTCSTCRYLDENQNCVLGIRCVNYTLWQGRIL